MIREKDKQNMLGFIGFLFAALVIAGFAYTSNRAYKSVDFATRGAFSAAFYLLALAMAIWAYTALGNDGAVRESQILATDTILLLATGYMVRVLFGELGSWMVVPVALLGASVLARRAYDFAPKAELHNGLLYFNLQRPVLAGVLIALLFVWLPAVMKIALQASRDKIVPQLQTKLTTIFTMLVLATGLFLSTQRQRGIVVSFILIILLFAIAATTNLLVLKVYKLQERKHAARQPAK